MAQGPLVSVVIPAYNRADLLSQACDSLRSQAGGQIEGIVVDDGSKQDLSEILRDPVFFYLRLEHSGYPSKVRNAGARLARGRYLAFLDSDDLWLPQKLQRQLRFFQDNPGIRIYHTRETWLRSGREVSQAGQKHRRSGFIFEDALKKCIIGPSTVMLERSLFEELGEFREDLEIVEDYELWLRLTARYPVGFIDEPLVVKAGRTPGSAFGKIRPNRNLSYPGPACQCGGRTFFPTTTASGLCGAGPKMPHLCRRVRKTGSGGRGEGIPGSV